MARGANGILLGKVLSAQPAILIKIDQQDIAFQMGLVEEIHKAIKSTARTITKTNLSDRVSSDTVLWKAGLPSITQAVSKCRQP